MLQKISTSLRSALSPRPSVQSQHLLNIQQRILQVQHDSLAMTNLSLLVPEYLPWTDAAMRPSGLLAVVNDIVLHSRTSCLECGSGLSTIYIATILQQLGGHLYSIEHDRDWARFVEAMLHRRGLQNVVSIIYAPLDSLVIGSESYMWYHEAAVKSQTVDLKIDLLLVDGPPAYTKETEHARYPALPFFVNNLADHYTIILDDVDRPGEQEVLARWEAEYKICFERRSVTGGIAIGRSGPQFKI